MWTKTTLGESCKMYQPKTISAKEMVSDGEYVVFGANGIIGRYDKYNHSEPQLLVTCRGATCGSVNISEPKSWITGNSMVIQPDTSKISMRFMEYVCRGGIDLSKAITGAAQPQITRKSLEPIEFSYPPLAEQQRIVATLDSAFAKIDEAISVVEAKETEVQQLKASLLSSFFSDNTTEWRETTLGDYYDVRDGTHDSPKYIQDGFPLVTSKNLKNGRIDLTNVKYISKEDYEDINRRSRVSVGDVLMAMIGTIGSPVEIIEPSNFAIKNVALFKTNEKQSPAFLFYFLSNPHTISKMMADAKGTTQKFVGLGYLRSFPILVPKLEVQEQIAEKLKSVYVELKNANDSILKIKAHYQALKSAILSQELQPSKAA